MAVTTVERFFSAAADLGLSRVIAVVFVAATAASITTRIAVGNAVSELGDRLLPTEKQDVGSEQSVHQPGDRSAGFMLTDNPVTLEQYSTGVTVADRLIPELRNDFTSAPRPEVLLKDLDEVVTAYGAWRSSGRPADQCSEPAHWARNSSARWGFEANTKFETCGRSTAR